MIFGDLAKGATTTPSAARRSSFSAAGRYFCQPDAAAARGDVVSTSNLPYPSPSDGVAAVAGGRLPDVGVSGPTRRQHADHKSKWFVASGRLVRLRAAECCRAQGATAGKSIDGTAEREREEQTQQFNIGRAGSVRHLSGVRTGER